MRARAHLVERESHSGPGRSGTGLGPEYPGSGVASGDHRAETEPDIPRVWAGVGIAWEQAAAVVVPFPQFHTDQQDTVAGSGAGGGAGTQHWTGSGVELHLVGATGRILWVVDQSSTEHLKKG